MFLKSSMECLLDDNSIEHIAYADDVAIILVILYLRTIVAASIEHEPKVHEELNENPPAYIRTARHLDGKQKMYQPPVYNYQAAVQQDRLQSRYSRQQKSESRNLKIAPINHDVIFGLQQYISQNRGTPMSIPFEDNDSDWKPYQPKFLNSAKPIKSRPIKPKNEISERVKHSNAVSEDLRKTDLDIAGSEIKEHTAETDRHDQRTQYVYVTPSTLRDKFGLDAKTTKQILQNSAPGREETNSDQYQISELQGLLGKNPSFQLQGLQKLLEDAKPIVENNLPISSEKDISGIQINHNGSPSVTATGAQLETLQQQLDALNKVQEEQIIAAAQKQAEAHVQAQHEALALVQKKAQDEALSKIAAHNQGLSTISPSEILNIPESVDHSTAAPFIAENSHASGPNSQEHAQEINQNSLELHKGSYVNSPEVQALQERPVEEVPVHPAKEYAGRYTSTTQDLRKNKPRIQGARGIYVQPNSFARPSVQQHQLQYLSAVPHLYNVNEVQSYSPVSPYTPHSSVQNEIDVPKVIPETIVTVPTPTLQEHGYESYQQNYVEPSSGNGQQLYSEDQHQYDDLHQYAAKYAFGYRILDEKHGNDFGHEEERDGKLTKGHYYVTLPDGRKQRVEYYADKSGYHAKVSYENVEKHPYIPRHQTEYVNHLPTGHK